MSKDMGGILVHDRHFGTRLYFSMGILVHKIIDILYLEINKYK